MGASSPLQVLAVGDLRAINAQQDWPHPSAKLHHAEGLLCKPPEDIMCNASAPVMDRGGWHADIPPSNGELSMYLVVDQTLDSRDFAQLGNVHLHNHQCELVLKTHTSSAINS